MPCSTPTSCTAADAGSSCSARPRNAIPLLPAQSGEPALCPASSTLVRAEPSGRGFRRNLRGVAQAALELAGALCRLAGAEEARICRRTDGAKSPASGHCSRRASVSIRCMSSTRRWATTTRKSRRSTPSSRRRLTTVTCPGCFPPIRGIAGRNRLRSSSGATAPTSGSWLRGGRARTS